jgi:hypothetical protein
MHSVLCINETELLYLQYLYMQYFSGEDAFCFVMYHEMVQQNNGMSTSDTVIMSYGTMCNGVIVKRYNGTTVHRVQLYYSTMSQ